MSGDAADLTVREDLAYSMEKAARQRRRSQLVPLVPPPAIFPTPGKQIVKDLARLTFFGSSCLVGVQTAETARGAL